MGVLVNGSFNPEMYNNMEHIIASSLKNVYEAPAREDYLYEPLGNLPLKDDIFQVWRYFSGGDHDFNGFEINAGGITVVRKIDMDRRRVLQPLYFVFVTAPEGENNDNKIIPQIQRIKINWRDSNDRPVETETTINKRKPARNHNNEKFEVSIRQDGADVEIRNNEVTIENREFDIVFNLSSPMGFIVKGSHNPETCIAAERGDVLTDLLEYGLGSTGTGRYFYRYTDRDNVGIKIGENDYWYYLNENDHRFSRTEVHTDGIMTIRTVAWFRDSSIISLPIVRSPLYLVFFSYIRGKDQQDISEIQRRFIKINWSSSEKTSTDIETLINSDKELSILDKTMNELYVSARGKVKEQRDGNTLSGEQQNWITYTRNSCLDKACLDQAYRERIKILSISDRNVIDPNEHVDSFNTTLGYGKSVRILYCERLADVSGRQNSVFGGICMMDEDGKRTKVKICDASMTDAHKMEPIGPEGLTDEELEEFTYKNCSGG
jgi:uncharacterized protein YecT (DUF1311 family)